MVTEPHLGPPIPCEIVEGVREFLSEFVLPELQDTIAFHTRVAINLLGIVERELRLGPELARDHRERLKRLGFDSERSLALAVRDGRADPRDPAVASAALEWVRSRLEIANPGYLQHPSFESSQTAAQRRRAGISDAH